LQSIEFLVERTFEGGDGRGYVVARLVDAAATFDLSVESGLGGYPVEYWLDMPRAVDANGRQRMDLFGFCLKRLSDRPRLNVGDRVVLE